MPRHVALLSRWLDAGRRMGLCDATVSAGDRPASERGASDYVLIWVRENIDPAYLIRPDGLCWVVIDAVREEEIGRTRAFASALYLIRPVLTVDEAA
jgi:hypothetical protein